MEQMEKGDLDSMVSHTPPRLSLPPQRPGGAFVCPRQTHRPLQMQESMQRKMRLCSVKFYPKP
jgi:hypothetical protein